MDIPKLGRTDYTFEEYLALEAELEERHEYHDGELLEMSKGTFEHSVIGSNVSTTINIALMNANRNCIVTNSEMKVYIEAYNKSVYPDALMLCEAPEFVGNNSTVLSNPALIVEVLSKSTRVYDKGEKFELYRALPSFQEYMLVWQSVPKVQTWYRADKNMWNIASAFGLDKSIYLHTLEGEVSLAAIYRNITNLNLEDSRVAY